MLVFVLNKDGLPLMPCERSKARKLLKQEKAKIVKYMPFTIQLKYGSSNYTQDVSIGVDLGSKHVGIAVQSNNKVISKGVIELRGDVKNNLETRKAYRRTRRTKLRYRQPRFLNRTSNKKEGWLPPSIQSRINNTFMWIDRFISLLPNPNLNIEVAKFDIQKIKNPNIQGENYSMGDTFGYYSDRYYVFTRDNYTCQVCKKSKNKTLNTHHIIFKSHGGTNSVDNLITVCTDCHTHDNHKENNVLYRWMIEKKKTPKYKEMPFMNILRIKVFEKYSDANIVYGSWTTPIRKSLQLEKEHYNDALVISGIKESFVDNSKIFVIKQFRKKKRSLHEGTARKGRSEPNTKSKRYNKNTPKCKGLFLNDKVSALGEIGWVSGFAGYMCYIKNNNNGYIVKPNSKSKSVNITMVTRIKHVNNWDLYYL